MGLFNRSASSIFLAVMLFVNAALAADFYVSPTGNDSNAGTQAAPFRTIQKADQVASAGSTIYVAPGSYGGGFTTTKSGTASARIVFRSTQQYGARIVGSGGATAESAWMSRGNYVDIIGFEIDGSSGAGLSWSTGIYLLGNNNTAQNNKVHDICVDSATFQKVSGGHGGAGIMVDGWAGGLNSSAIGNMVYNIGPNNQNSDLVHGIYQATSGNVINNVVYNIVGDGITSWHDAHHINIINNTVYRARGQGILVGAGDSGVNGGALSSSAGNYFNVFNNVVVGSFKYGIDEHGSTGSNNFFYNNLVYASGYGAFGLQNGKQSGSIQVDPKFVNATAGDFRLASGSPAIDKGTSSQAPARDVAGADRPQGAAIDIGAYEFGSGEANPAPTPVPATPAPTPTPTPVPPSQVGSVQLVISGDPAAGAYIVEAKTTVAGSLRVEFYDNGILRTTEKGAPYCLTPEVNGACVAGKLGNGSHNLVVKVFTSSGNTVLAQANRTFAEGTTAMFSGVKSFESKISAKCMDVMDASTSNNAVLQQWTCGTAAHKRFELIAMGNNQYSLKARHSGKCLDVSASSKADGAAIIQYTCKSSANQKFILKDMGGGYYSLVAVHSGKCVDVDDPNLENGARIHQWTCHGRDNQLFKMNN